MVTQTRTVFFSELKVLPAVAIVDFFKMQPVGKAPPELLSLNKEEWIMSYRGCQPIYQPTSWSTVSRHNRHYIVRVSVKYLLRVGHYIDQVTFYCQWSIGQKSVNKSSNKLGWIISVVCQRCIGELLVEYQ